MKVIKLIVEDQSFYCPHCCSNLVEIKLDMSYPMYNVCGCPMCGNDSMIGIDDHTWKIGEMINQVLGDVYDD